MNDIAEQNKARRFVVGDQRAQAIERVVFGRDRHQLSLRAMTPGVSEMQICDGQQLFFAKVNSAARIENNAEQEFEGLQDGWAGGRHKINIR